jgi:hypothetical protein
LALIFTFFPPSRACLNCEEMYTPISTRARADILRSFDILKHQGATTPGGAAGQSLTIDAIGSTIDFGAIAPPRANATKWRGGRPHESPGLTESELPNAGDDTSPI